MSAGLSQLQATTCGPLAAPPGLELFFIIDQRRSPDARARLAATGDLERIEYLFASTDYPQFLKEGPLWLSAKADTELASLAASLCLENRAGISILATDEASALAHARWLLVVNDHAGGQSLATYWLPELWATLALTGPDALFGSWLEVYSPVPRHLLECQEPWYRWSAPANAPYQQMHYSLADGIEPVHDTLRRLYWLEGRHTHFHNPLPGQLLIWLDNLALLEAYGITQGRHLTAVTPLAQHTHLRERADVMDILASRDKVYIKVERLAALAD